MSKFFKERIFHFQIVTANGPSSCLCMMNTSSCVEPCKHVRLYGVFVKQRYPPGNLCSSYFLESFCY